MPEPTPVLPEVLSQIRALAASSRPLIVCDVDEVILHLIKHLEIYLHERGMHFSTHAYRFSGNIFRKDNQTALSAEEVRRLLQVLFDEVSDRQEMVSDADTALRALSSDWDIVLLTNLPGGHNKKTRETLLAGFGIPYPVVTNSGPKGGAVAALSAQRPVPVVFIDDSPANHVSVHATLPSAAQIQFIADPRFRASVEPEAHIGLLTGDWNETKAFINAILRT